MDPLLLAHVLPVGRAFVRPVGGKRGMRAFIEGYLGTYQHSPPTFLGFRDRDFDAEPAAQSGLIRLPGEKPIYLTHRAAVENYFIDADLIWQYWTEREQAPGWNHGPALSLAEIEDLIAKSARELAGYQAVRWALASLKPGPRWPEVATTWTRGSGSVPTTLEYSDCLAKACRLVESYSDQLRDVHTDRMTEYAQAYREQFSDEQFFANRGYLVWFHGKDHLVRLCHQLAPSFPRRHYAAWAAEHVDIGKHADLQQLADLTLFSAEEKD